MKYPRAGIFLLLFLAGFCHQLMAEGSKDLVSSKGYRLFYNAQQRQQLKVFAEAGEFIHVGASHIGVSGGFIRVIRPNGSVHTVFNGSGQTAGLGIIHNRTQEINGPTGGGSVNGQGYVPGVIEVQNQEAGVWTILLEYPTYSTSAFNNVLATEDWNRQTHQPLNQRVVLAWDVTVSKLLPINEGGEPLTGRLFTQEFVSLLNDNGYLADLSMYVLSAEGIVYRISMEDLDPWGWFISSNNRGIVDATQLPVYKSLENTGFIRSWQSENWMTGNLYHYEPQTRDIPFISNNKLFFNPPDPALPAKAPVWDVYRTLGYSTWLNAPLPDYANPLTQVDFSALQGADSIYSLCGQYVMGEGLGGHIRFYSIGWGELEIRLDINQNGSFTDPEDVLMTKLARLGLDSVFWDGRDGLGNVVPAQLQFPLKIEFQGTLRSGEMHLMLFDVENMPGGLTVTRLNGPGSGPVAYYFDHSAIGGDVSGGGTPGAPQPAVDTHSFANGLGDEKLMDYWSYVSLQDLKKSVTLYIDIVKDCYDPNLDSDGDGIIDVYDLDDDNDGIPDRMEYCGGSGFSCLPGGLDPSGDVDKDRVLNFMDADDPAFVNPCQDLDGDGICDRVAGVYDTDGDGVPNHLDLDSDQDGMSDLYEAQHGAPDVMRDGRIDAPLADFGDNGFYNPLADKPNGLDAVANYLLPDLDGDGLHDQVDLDSDNDGIHDVAENGLGGFDGDQDGRIDDGNGLPVADAVGIPVQLSPLLTGKALPLPIDFDGDGVRNQNDLDSDNDGLHDVTETPGLDPDGDGLPGKGNPITDALGRPIQDATGVILKTTSQPLNSDGVEGADFQDLDSDDDGIWDAYEAGVLDLDFDGIAGTGVPQINLHGVPTVDANGQPIIPVTNPPDFDGDGLPNYRDRDSDDDGISDGYECYDIPNGYTELPCLDTDGDGIPDWLDLDSDDDGLPDIVECPNGDSPDCPDSSGNGVDDFRDPNLFFNEDTDGDGIPNTVDLDNDNDGIPDHWEFCAQKGFDCLPGGLNPDGDEDADLIPNFMDADDPQVQNPCEDVNLDGICDRVHEVYDGDRDGIANHNDLDSDNDGIPDMYEAGHTVQDPDGNGRIDAPNALFGQNGLYNLISTHPDHPDATVIYSIRKSDADQVPDFRDLDSDNDGIHDLSENGLAYLDSNGDGRADNGQGEPDIGWMGIPRLINPVTTGQPLSFPRDTDGDQLADFRDVDSDNDGIHDVAEQKSPDPDGDGIPGVSPVTVHADGRLMADAGGLVLVSLTDEQHSDNDGIPDYLDLDADGDGIPDVLEAQWSDPDKDGKAGVSPVQVNSRGGLQSDANGTSLASISNPRDLDGDGDPDFQDIDRDGDGIRDGYECFTPYQCVDTDGDGQPDVDDLNSDGDCETDEEECPGGDPCPDSSGNGLPDYREFACCPPFEPVIEVGSTQWNACSGQQIILSGQNTNPFPADITYTWTGPGFVFTNTVSNQAPLNAPLVPGLGSGGTYTLSAVSAQGCAGPSVQIALNVKQTPAQPTLQADPTLICIGDEVILSTQLYTGPGLSYEWRYTGSGGQTIVLGATSDPVLIIPDAAQTMDGAYTVKVTVDGCTSIGSIPVILSVLPPAELHAGDDDFILQLEDEMMEGNVMGNDVFNTGSVQVSLVKGPEVGQLSFFANGGFRYTAEPGFEGNVTFTYQICGELCDSECDTATVTVRVRADNIPEDCHVFNIITPNEDGSNDALVIPCLDRYPKHELRIFNRWGDEVYYTDQYNQDWAGLWNNHPLPPGTYFYSLQVYGDNPQSMQGYVTIIR